jgi:hypothetical protein
MSKETSICHSEGPPEESLRPFTRMSFLFLSSGVLGAKACPEHFDKLSAGCEWNSYSFRLSYGHISRLCHPAFLLCALCVSSLCSSCPFPRTTGSQNIPR